MLSIALVRRACGRWWARIRPAVVVGWAGDAAYWVLPRPRSCEVERGRLGLSGRRRGGVCQFVAVDDAFGRLLKVDQRLAGVAVTVLPGERLRLDPDVEGCDGQDGDAAVVAAQGHRDAADPQRPGEALSRPGRGDDAVRVGPWGR